MTATERIKELIAMRLSQVSAYLEPSPLSFFEHLRGLCDYIEELEARVRELEARK